MACVVVRAEQPRSSSTAGRQGSPSWSHRAELCLPMQQQCLLHLVLGFLKAPTSGEVPHHLLPSSPRGLQPHLSITGLGCLEGAGLTAPALSAASAQ